MIVSLGQRKYMISQPLANTGPKRTSVMDGGGGITQEVTSQLLKLKLITGKEV